MRTLHNAHGGLDGSGCMADGGVQLLAARLALQARLHALHLPQLCSQSRSHGCQQALQPPQPTVSMITQMLALTLFGGTSKYRLTHPEKQDGNSTAIFSDI